MTSNRVLMTRLYQGFLQSDEVESVLEGMDRVEQLIENGELSEIDGWDLRVDAFRALMRLTADDPKRGEGLILNYLVPLCVVNSSAVPQDARVALSRYRECLSEWLATYLTIGHREPRDRVLDDLMRRLDAVDPSGACWSIASIGYRRNDVVDRLQRIVQTDDGEVGDTALVTLLSLSGQPIARRALQMEVVTRAERRLSSPLISALARLTIPHGVSVVQAHALRGRDDMLFLKDILLRLPARIAGAAPDDAYLQDAMWHVVLSLREQDEGYREWLYLAAQIGARCNSKAVVPELLGWLAHESGDEEQKRHQRGLIYSRLQECNRPRHLYGWDTPIPAAVLEILRDDASLDTEATGLWATRETMLKRSVWDIILRAAVPDCRIWLEEALPAETSPFVQQSMVEILAYLNLSVLPEIVAKWIVEPYDLNDGPSSQDWAPRLAAIKVARSIASREAFDALLRFGLTSKGQILQQSVDALSEVAALLAASGDESVVAELVREAVTGRVPRHRRAAIGALPGVARDLSQEHVQQLMTSLVRDEREPFEQGALVAALGTLPLQLEGQEEWLSRLEAWAERDDWFGWRALESLARSGHLQGLPELLTSRLGLLRKGLVWDLDPATRRIEWSGYIIGLLYRRDPEAFTPAVASIVRDQDWSTVVQVLALLKADDLERGEQRVPIPVQEALMARLLERQTYSAGETDLFEALVHIAPQVLLQTSLIPIFSQWILDSRVAFADALGLIHIADAGSRDTAMKLLIVLAGDAQYAVRRAAYRSIARQDSEVLETLCSAWLETEDSEDRARAAEAFAWLPDRPQASVTAEELYRRCISDPEPLIRERGEQAWQERRERIWAGDYLLRVQGALERETAEILPVWRYGQALIAFGDDDTIRQLRAMRASLPFQKRLWVDHMVKEIEKRWRKVTQKWPDPWISIAGAIEQGRGTLSSETGKTLNVDYVLWQRPAPTPSEKHSWGGIVSSSSLLSLWAHALDDTSLRLTLDDGRIADLLFSSVTGGMAVIVGQGPYPAHID